MGIEQLVELQNLPSWTSKKTVVRCVNVIQETPDVKTFQFESKEPCLFHFKPGQFIGLQIEVNGERHNRSYTIASSPTRPHQLELTIKKETGGAVSPWLHENIKNESSLEIRGPAGRFNNMDIKSDEVLLISAGSGITPMMSMARFWADSETNKNIRFLNWVRSADDIIFRRELGLMEHKNVNFNLDVICTQPGLSQNWLGRRGRINTTTLLDMVPDIKNRTVFCCGPQGFMDQVKHSLEELAFDMTQYHDESFDPGGKKKARDAQQTNQEPVASPIKPAKRQFTPHYQVKLLKSDRILDITPNDILLEKLESENVEVSSSCRGGNCGACRVKKVAGKTITDVEDGLTDENRMDGDILTCTTKVYSDIELDL